MKVTISKKAEGVVTASYDTWPRVKLLDRAKAGTWKIEWEETGKK